MHVKGNGCDGFLGFRNPRFSLRLYNSKYSKHGSTYTVYAGCGKK